jgi:predicted Rossmann fold flavoprotein
VRAVDVVVIGAGAAGLMAAATAAQRGRSVLVLEHSDTIGAKILISGGGRCNFTNLEVKPDRFISANPHFAKSALAGYTQWDFIDLVRRYDIAFYEKTLGQLFCEGAGAAKRIVAMLVAEVEGPGGVIETGVRVTSIQRAERFELATTNGPIFAESVILATGGLSIPKIGATDFAYRVARAFGLPIVDTRPGLVPVTCGGEHCAPLRELAGVSFDGAAQGQGPSFAEAVLFTHKGLSGPAVLQASSYWRPGETLRLTLAPDGADWLIAAKRTRPKARPATVLAERFAERLATALAGGLAGPALPDRPMADLRDAELRAMGAALASWEVAPTGDEGYAKAEVTLGGVSTDALSQKSLMAKSVPGLFVIGEAVDVTGWLGGYNFQWAWSSGVAAGRAA